MRAVPLQIFGVRRVRLVFLKEGQLPGIDAIEPEE